MAKYLLAAEIYLHQPGHEKLPAKGFFGKIHQAFETGFARMREGYRGILSAGYYIDLNQPAAEHYAVDPLLDGTSTLSPEQAKNILGGEATMWTELVTPENINTRIWPRTAAIAERFWSPQNVTNVASMYQRMDLLSQKLAYYGVPVEGIGEQMLLRLGAATDQISVFTTARRNVPSPASVT